MLRMIYAIFFIITAAVGGVENLHNRVARQMRLSTLRRTTPARQNSSYAYLNGNTKRFLVNGTRIPEVDFDIGESYAGLLPNRPSGNSSLFFWFFPSQNAHAKDEIAIWLNGGPGCSSLDGLLQGSGPFIWRPGTFKPIFNAYSWTNLTNMVYVDQPAGTGFSPGPARVNDEKDVAMQFNDWFRNFADTFDLHYRKVYIVGESYVGQYIPYIAEAMLDADDPKYFNLRGIQLNDPYINEQDVMIQVPAVAHLNHYSNVIALNQTFMKNITQRAERCGYNSFLGASLKYPPPAKFPIVPDVNAHGCRLWDEILTAAYYVNPCFNLYHLTDYCPYLWDQMEVTLPGGVPSNYFNRTDVQKVLNVPPTTYYACSGDGIFPNGDQSVPSGLGLLPRIIERTNNTIIAHGWLDFLFFVNGSLVTIQNMTWNGARGFQHPPTEPLFVPYHYGSGEMEGPIEEPRMSLLDAGAGYMGTAHTERGLTFTTVYLAGHQIPQYAPGAAYRQLEFLLGRIESLSQKGGYSA